MLFSTFKIYLRLVTSSNRVEKLYVDHFEKDTDPVGAALFKYSPNHMKFLSQMAKTLPK